MTETQTTTVQAPAPLAYSVEMVERMRVLINEEIRQTELKASRRIAELRQAMADIEAKQAALPTFHSLLPEGRQDYPERIGRDPYANAPKWADRTDERIQRITSLPDDGGPDDGERCA